MNFDMPKAMFYGLALITAALYFGPGSVPAEAQGGIQKIASCDPDSRKFVAISGGGYLRNALQVNNRVVNR